MVSPLDGLAKTIGKAMKGIFFDAVITRATPGSTTSPYTKFDPGPPGSETFACKAIAEEYSLFARGQGMVDASDMRVIILAETLSTTPKPLDRIEIASLAFSGRIVAGDAKGQPAVKTDPVKATWECRCAT